MTGVINGGGFGGSTGGAAFGDAGSGGAGGHAMPHLGGGVGEMLPFTGFSTIPLALAGLVAVIAGAISTWYGNRFGSPGQPPR